MAGGHSEGGGWMQGEGMWRVPPRLILLIVSVVIIGVVSLDLTFGTLHQNSLGYMLGLQTPQQPPEAGAVLATKGGLSPAAQAVKKHRGIVDSLEDEDGVPNDPPDMRKAFTPGAKRSARGISGLQLQEPEGIYVPEDSRAEIFECDRTSGRTNICTLKGDVEVDTDKGVFKLLAKGPGTPRGNMSVRPHPRKQFAGALDSITPLPLQSVDSLAVSDPFLEMQLQCTAVHAATGIVFSTNGHTGNYYHDMNDGWVPLFITLYPYHREVILILSDPKQWWLDKYQTLIFSLTKYPVIKLFENQGLHCFREVKLGLQTHGDLMVDPSRTIGGFKMEQLGQRWARTLGLNPLGAARVSGPVPKDKPLRLGFVHRAEFDRVLLNEPEVLEVARKVGFEVVVINRFSSMVEMLELIRTLDVLVGVHGSGLSNFIFMRGNAVLIQVTPFELEWFSDNSFGYGSQYHVHYLNPILSWEESSLSKQHSKDSEVYKDGVKISQRDYDLWCRLYLQANVTWELQGAEKTFQEAKEWLITPGNEVVCNKYDCPMEGAQLPAYRAAIKAGKKPEPKGLRPPDKPGDQKPDARRRLLQHLLD